MIKDWAQIVPNYTIRNYKFQCTALILYEQVKTSHSNGHPTKQQ